MRISDWSSDVCSSDLGARAYAFGYRFDLRHPLADEVAFCQWGRVAGVSRYAAATGMAQHHDVLDLQRVHAKLDGGAGAVKRDRKSVVKGKSVSVRVDLGGRRIIKKKKKKTNKTYRNT